MSYLLRKISITKWQPNLTLAPDQFSGDAITGCIRTSGNTLSVWSSSSDDFASDEVEKIVVALATTMTTPDVIDVVWLDEDWLRQHGVDIKSEPGLSKFGSVNPMHRDLVSINHKQLAIVGKHIVDQYNKAPKTNYKRFSKPALIALVKKWVEKEDTFKLEDLNEKWIASLNKKK
ncbi:hypothetical protein [Pantoea ananatis]|uniref:hypothetical protein n=1 Tax=Pantoea ananas TaxID=553 RepID=UPI00137571D3|nr:hypothetical protein [Pantoea ananatis]NCU07400.1 hypothetical protein [Pantoea ananatis]